MWFVLGAVAVVMAAVLFAPVAVDLSIAKDAESTRPMVRARFRWLLLSFRTGSGARAGRQPPAPKPEKRPSRYGWPSVRAALASPGFARRATRLLVSLLRLVRPDRWSAHGHIGLDDPADTGILLGWLYALQRFSPSRRESTFRIEPDFSGATMEGRVDLGWSRSFAAVLWPLVTFLFSPVVWRAAIRAHRSARHQSRQGSAWRSKYMKYG